MKVNEALEEGKEGKGKVLMMEEEMRHEGKETDEEDERKMERRKKCDK